MTEWIEMLVTMSDGPKKPVRGVVVPYRKSDEPFHYYYGSYGEEPVFLPWRRDGIRLLRWGRRSRIETLDGHVMFVSDGSTAWDFTSDPDKPRCTGLRNVHSPGSGRNLVITPRVEHWVGDHHARPIGPVTDVEFLGRRCWSVELAPRESVKMPTSSLRLVVDADTGTVLAQHSGDGIDGAEYTEFAIDEGVDPALFAWDGPVVTDVESRVRAGHGSPETDRAKALQWFRENITAEPIELPILTDFTPRYVNLIDPPSGGFSAELGDRAGWLIRRPRAEGAWAVKTHGEQICWSTGEFDWACQIHRGTIDDAGIALLQHYLHPSEHVVGAPMLVFGGSDGP